MWILVGQKGESKAPPNTESEVCFLRVQKYLDLLPSAKPQFIRVLWLVSLWPHPKLTSSVATFQQCGMCKCRGLLST